MLGVADSANFWASWAGKDYTCACGSEASRLQSHGNQRKVNHLIILHNPLTDTYRHFEK